MNPSQLRKKHPRFIYESFKYSLKKKGVVCEFKFKLEPNIIFTPKIEIISNRDIDTKKLSNNELDNFVFHLGLAEIPSYWKCAISPKIEIRAGELNSEQIKWWHKLLLNGLGEFFYVNKIDLKKYDFSIKSTNSNTLNKERGSKKSGQKFLVLVGGGKDSLVVIDIIKKSKTEIETLVLGDIKASFNLIKSFGLKKPVVVKRIIDKKLLELNKKGYLNGHVPFSAYLAFLGVFSAKILGYSDVVVGNERSANEPNLILANRKINHQYSKSYEFEKSFRNYLKKYISENISYFSTLRPIHELQIAKLASNLQKNLIFARSCNINMKRNSWCGKCPKCISVFILLYPFMQEEKIIDLFGKNFLNDKNLWKYIIQLTDKGVNKPFDCVATRRENIAALNLAILKTGIKMPYLLKKFSQLKNIEKISAEKINGIMRSWNNNNFLPKNIAEILKKEIINK